MYLKKSIRHGLEVTLTMLITLVLSANAVPSENGECHIKSGNNELSKKDLICIKMSYL